MNIEHCREFIELAQRLNFTETASYLNITQSALSKHVSMLESEFGAPFFNRSRRNVKITEAGRMFFEYACMVVEHYESTKQSIAGIKSSKPVRIVGHTDDPEVSTVCTTAVTIARNRQQMPCTVTTGHRIARPGEADAADVFVGYIEPDAVEQMGYACRELFATPLCAAMATSHPLSRRTQLTWKDLEGQTFVHFVSELTDSAWNQIMCACRDSEVVPRTRSIALDRDIELFSVPLQSNVLIWKTNDPQLAMLVSAGLRACIPIVDEANSLIAYAAYLPEDEERLQPFFAALDEACRLLPGQGKPPRKKR